MQACSCGRNNSNDIKKLCGTRMSHFQTKKIKSEYGRNLFWLTRKEQYEENVHSGAPEYMGQCQGFFENGNHSCTDKLQYKSLPLCSINHAVFCWFSHNLCWSYYCIFLKDGEPVLNSLKWVYHPHLQSMESKIQLKQKVISRKLGVNLKENRMFRHVFGSSNNNSGRNHQPRKHKTLRNHSWSSF
jgi:hypothetical protein